MGNVNSYEITYDKFYSLYDPDDYTMVCNDVKECVDMYNSRLDEYYETIAQITSDSMLEYDNDLITAADKSTNLEIAAVKIIATIMARDKKEINETNFNTAKQEFINNMSKVTTAPDHAEEPMQDTIQHNSEYLALNKPPVIPSRSADSMLE